MGPFTEPWGAAAPEPPRFILGSRPPDPWVGGLPPPNIPAGGFGGSSRPAVYIFLEALFLGVQYPASSHRKSNELRWGAKLPASIDAFPGGERPFGHPNIKFREQLRNMLRGCQGSS